MKISVIIPTYNEKESLGDCIESLGTQTFKDFEIIVVDDGSTDGTVQVLENLASSLPNFKFVRELHKGPGAARNLGAKHANGNILVLVDADMTFDKNFLETLVHPIEKGEVKGVFNM